MMSLIKNPYIVLQVSETASDDELKKSYRRLSRMYHPDLNPNNKEAEEKFKELGEAYEILSDSQKRKQYDMGTYNPTDQTVNTTTNSNAYDIFNEVFQDNIKNYNKEREDYVKFLDKMEPEFNKYGKTLKSEKENVLKSVWSVFILLDSFSNKKARIKKELKDLERNAKGFDDFLIFFEGIQKEIKQYGFQFNNVEQYIEPSQKGIISADFYSNLKSQIRNQLNTLSRNIKAFDEHMQFLDEMEKNFNQYNKTIKKMKEDAKGKRGKFSIDQICIEQQKIREELSKLQKKARAFDDFSEYYLKASQEIQNLYSRKLINFDEYLNPKNRVLFEPEVFIEKKCEISNIISKLSVERIEKVKQLREELEKRNLNFGAYLSTRNTDEFTISISRIETILKSIDLIDKINATLVPFGITIEDFLKSRGRLLIDMKYEQLSGINDAINNYINNTKEVNFADINLIGLGEDDVKTRNCKK